MGELFEQSATGSSVYTVHRPLGVVGLITPWNFPAAIPLWKSAPALIYGNTVVMKLAQEAPLTGLHIAAAFDEAGLPPGVLNIVIGRGSEVGTPLVAHPQVRAISFTGSVAVGTQVRDEATALGKRVQLELGGQNPLIVMADADLGRAVEAAYAGAFWSAGQKCTATRRIYVQSPVYDEFRSRLLERIESGTVGDPADPATEVGPVVNEKQLEEILAGIERGQGRGRHGDRRRRADRRRGVPARADALRGRRRRRVPLVRGGVRAGQLALPLRRPRRGARPRERGRVRPLGVDLHQRPADDAAVRRRARGRACSTSTRRPPAPTSTCRSAGSKGSGFGPHEQGRAAMEFYTEVVTVYHDA